MTHVLTVIPSRMGSERVPGKNMRDLCGSSLLQRAVDCGVGDVVVSTDEEWVARIQAHLSPSGVAQVIARPKSLLGPKADIADATRHALLFCENHNQRRYEYVVTLQPAVPARSYAMVRAMVASCIDQKARGGLTLADSHPWVWVETTERLRNWWHPGPYPRSQDAGRWMVEINSVQIAARDVVLSGKRWDFPMVICHIPAWASALDIDTMHDLNEARRIFPGVESYLEDGVFPLSLQHTVDTWRA